MPPPLERDEKIRRLRALLDHKNMTAAARALGIEPTAMSHFKNNRSRDEIKRDLEALLGGEVHDIEDPRHMERVLAEECAKAGIPVEDVSVWWYKTERASIFARGPGGKTYMEMRDEIIEQMTAHAPAYAPVTHAPGDHLLVAAPADVHIGALSRQGETGANYDIDEAVRRITVGVDGLLAKAVPHGVGQVVLAIGNDIMHIDTPRRTTTSGTFQDTSGQFWEMFDHAKSVLVRVIERLVQIAPVHVVHVPSNHDWVSGYFLADTLSSWFRNHPQVTFDVTMNHRKYIVFGLNLIGFTHGDGAKEANLPNLMQHEQRQAWGQTKRGYWYCGHIHHKVRRVYALDGVQIEKDHIGVTVMHTGPSLEPDKSVHVEYLRSPTPADGWHHRNGFVSHQAIECFLHHPQHGQSARFTEYF